MLGEEQGTLGILFSGARIQIKRAELPVKLPKQLDRGGPFTGGAGFQAIGEHT